jgi:type I restriction enzyme, S subunit
MTFPKYPEYKDSGVEWLGEVPAHWVVGPLRWYATIQGGVAKGKSYFDDTPTVDLPYLRVANVQDGHVDLSSVNTVTVALSEVDRYRLQPGDVLMNEGGDNDKLGRGAVWQGEIADCLHQNHVFAIRPNRHLLPYWLSMFTRTSAARSYFYLYSKQSTNLASISSSNVMSCPLPLPPQEEQRQVLSFLDHEAARIDALVEEKQRLIELLKEKRQAVISHAVTKGLGPDVPMKDSGVEWLGEVPAHWKIKRLKHISSSIKAGPFGSALTKDMYQQEGYRVYGQEQVIPGDFSVGDYYISDESFKSLSQYEVKEGDILISCVGTFGKIAIVPNDAAPGIINPRLIRLRVHGVADPAYLEVVLKSQPVFEQFSVLSRGGTMDVINAGTLSEIFLPVPTREEQEEILEYVVTEKARIDSLMVQAKNTSELLKERRSALISAAVTGKIDVRGWQPPAGSSTPAETTQTEMV